MKKWSFVALLVLGATILGATVFKEPIAWAAQAVDANIIGPLDGQGNVKAHEQGTAQVAGTVGLSALANSVKIDPTNARSLCGSNVSCDFPSEIEASLITVELEAGVQFISLHGSSGEVTLYLFGPAEQGQSHYVLPLTQPIRVQSMAVGPGCSTQCFVRVSVAGTFVP